MNVLGTMTALIATGVTAETSRQLAAAPAGRVVLHVLCACRDHHFAWHWHGVVREFALA